MGEQLSVLFQINLIIIALNDLSREFTSGFRTHEIT